MSSPVLSLVPPSSTCLWTPTKPVVDIESEVKPFISAMKALMDAQKGVGLSANQVGISLSFFIWQSPHGFAVVINPKITERTGWNSSALEGCLSFPNRETYVARNTIIRATWIDEDNNAHDETMMERWARIFQHETDHTLGKAIFPRPGCEYA